VQREQPITFRVPVEWRVWFAGSGALRFLVWRECRKRGVPLRNKSRVLEVVDHVKNELRRIGTN